ncbi:MAG: VOC family protein, partial [Nitrospinota bacterium]
KAEAFYVGVLGMEVEWRPDPKNLYLRSVDRRSVDRRRAEDNLALHEVEAGEGFRDAEAQHLDHIGFLVRTPEEVDAWAEYIRSKGIPLEREPRTHRDGARSFYFRDPDGNLIQLICHPPISGGRSTE